jgi:hypothetical protein
MPSRLVLGTMPTDAALAARKASPLTTPALTQNWPRTGIQRSIPLVAPGLSGRANARPNPHQGGSPLRCFVEPRSRAPPPAHERACESGAVVEEGPVRMTQWHERSTERPLNWAMPKQPRVSLPNLDSLALSTLAGCMRERILSQVLKSAPLAVQLQHAHPTAPFYQLRTDCSGKPAVILERW